MPLTSLVNFISLSSLLLGLRETIETREAAIHEILQNEGIAKQVQLLEQSNEIFDFRELASQSLSKHWKTLSTASQDHFVDVLQKLIEHSILDKMSNQKKYRFNIIQLKTTDKHSTLTASVSTPSTKKESAAQFQLLLRQNKKGDWLIYDLILDDVSMIVSYRQQFEKIIAKEGLDSLIDKMEKRLEKITTSSLPGQ